MARHDKDRFQKELAIRYCLARGIVPFLEVNVRSLSDLSDSVETLTDLDVVGVESMGDGGLRRTIFDCKTTRKMSSVNRAFWAAGVMEFSNCDEAYVILRNKAVHNHRMAALALNVDLHDEASFKDLGRTVDQEFPKGHCYQSSLDGWMAVDEAYARNTWSVSLLDLSRNVAPLTRTPWSAFRKILAELRAIRGSVDPENNDHISIVLDLLASVFVLWATLARDIRRFCEPDMDKRAFEKVLRYYIWGGKESYEIRQQIRSRVESSGESRSIELPAWPTLLSFAGLVIGSPQSVIDCALVCRDLSIRVAAGTDPEFEKRLNQQIAGNVRIRQFTAALGEYLVAAGGLPTDLSKRLESILFDL